MIQYEPKSFLRILFGFRGSVFLAVLPRVTVAAAIAWLAHRGNVRIPPTVHSLLGVALGLLLVFRTNASYDRYWEGRKLLGQINNRARDLMRQSAAYIEGDDADAKGARAEIRRLVVLFYSLVRQHLRAERDLSKLRADATPEERAALEPASTRPALALAWLSRHLGDNVRAGRIRDAAFQKMDDNLTSFVDAYGGCERILRTPIPFAYAQHIKAFLSLFCFTVPFALVDSLHQYTPVAAAVIAYGLFGIEEIGVEIEDPFGTDPNDLPLDAIGERIAEDAKSVLADRDRA